MNTAGRSEPTPDDLSGRIRAALACLIAYAVLVVADVIAELTRLRLADLIPVAMMPLLIAATVASRPRSTTRTMLIIALVFAWLGDVAGVTVLLKIGFFLGTQLTYCLLFRRLRRPTWPTRRAQLIIFALIMAVVVVFVAGQAQDLVIPVIIYGVLLSVMVAYASGVSRLTTVGAGLFLVSDIALGYSYFLGGSEQPWIGALVMGIYLPAQLVITIGVLRATALPRVKP